MNSFVKTWFYSVVTYIFNGIETFLQRSYSGPCNLRPPIQPAKYGLKLKVVLK